MSSSSALRRMGYDASGTRQATLGNGRNMGTALITICITGDIVNIIGSFSTSSTPGAESTQSDPDATLPTCILSYSSDNVLIVHPDTLVSATRVADAPICRRKAVVQEKIRSTNDTSPALVYGNLLHELFQSCLLAMSEARDDTKHANCGAVSSQELIEHAFGPRKREEEIERLLKVPKNIEMLFMIGVELDDARHYLRDKSAGYGDFAERFVGETPKVSSFHRLLKPRKGLTKMIYDSRRLT